FGGRVVGLPELALGAVHRRDVHHAAPAALGHAVDEGLGHVVHGIQIRAQHGVPLFLAQFAEGAVAGDAGIVHQYVDLMAVGDDALGGGLAGVIVGHIDVIHLEGVARVGLFLEPGIGAARACVVGNKHGAAGIVQPAGNGFAQAAGATGDQCATLGHDVFLPCWFGGYREKVGLFFVYVFAGSVGQQGVALARRAQGGRFD